MALSNWAIACWNEKGKPSVPALKYKTNATHIISIYKNWVVVTERNAVVLEVFEGIVNYKNAVILVKNIKQREGIFFYYAVSPKNKDDEMPTRLGIAMYGFDEDKWVGIRRKTYEEFLRWVTDKLSQEIRLMGCPVPKHLEYWSANQGTIYLIEKSRGKKFTNDELREWLSNEERRVLLNHPILFDIIRGASTARA